MMCLISVYDFNRYPKQKKSQKKNAIHPCLYMNPSCFRVHLHHRRTAAA